MRGPRRALRRFVVFLTIITALLYIEGAAEWIVQGTPSYTYIVAQEGAKQSVLTVHFAGLQSDGDTQSLPLQQVWKKKKQDALVVKYDPLLTSSSQVVDTTYNEILRRGYSKITLNLTSMGGRLGTDLIDYIREQGNHIEVTGVILRDAPMTGTDVLGSNHDWGLGASLAPPSRVLNLVLNWIVPAFFFQAPTTTEPMSPAEIASLHQHWFISQHWPLSGETSQSRQVFWRLGIPANTYKGIPVIIIRASADNLVSHDNSRWLAAFSVNDDRVIIVSSQYGPVPHASIREFPRAWRDAEERAYIMLYPAA